MSRVVLAVPLGTLLLTWKALLYLLGGGETSGFYPLQHPKSQYPKCKQSTIIRSQLILRGRACLNKQYSDT